MPAPTIEPTTMAVIVQSENFCSEDVVIGNSTSGNTTVSAYVYAARYTIHPLGNVMTAEINVAILNEGALALSAPSRWIRGTVTGFNCLNRWSRAIVPWFTRGSVGALARHERRFHAGARERL